MTVTINRVPVEGTTRKPVSEATKARRRAFRADWKAVGRAVRKDGRISSIYGKRKRQG